jgi:hypothetical protein
VEKKSQNIGNMNAIAKLAKFEEKKHIGDRRGRVEGKGGN